MEPLDRIRISLASSSKQEREVIDLFHRHPGINGPAGTGALHRSERAPKHRAPEHPTPPLASTPESGMQI